MMLSSPSGKLSQETKEAVRRISGQFRETAALNDASDRFPEENIQLIAALGLHAAPLSKHDGGLDAGFVETSWLIAEFAKGCPSTALCMAMHYYTLAALKDKLPEAISEEVLRDVQHNREFFSSFNLANVTTFHPGFDYRDSVSVKIRKADSGYLINGFKKFVSAAERFKYLPVLGSQEDAGKSFYGLTALLLQKNDPGVTVEKTWDLSGMRATLSHDVYFKDVWVPVDRRIGREGCGLEDTSNEYYWSRLAISSVYLGIAQAAVEYAADIIRAKKDWISQKPVATMPGAQFAYADLRIKLETAGSQLLAYASQADEELRLGKFSNELYQKALITKYVLSNTVNEIVWEAMQMEGIRSLARGSMLERLFRDARAATFHYPSNDLLKEMLAKTSLGIVSINGRWG
ncbi:acyl-CoA dehydrogenase family protein [Paenibacillus tarimensis]|uniref:acyl-CoA dehydrogenase family protein n=1 Tax=Paenibacillus tarimensis TaxID=416012 RepID=UPI001F320C78|nr:acyl-CoA dehydrogenase family protein [Paenibacillus tarimensis]MCF2945174.1 acyl-CoA/acyl-ACP dehydrogenase [Paenibacillus tarimensis]